MLEEKLDVLRGMLRGFDYSDFMAGGHRLLAGAANLRLLVKRILRKYKWPQDGQEGAITLVLAQADMLSTAWT